MIACHTPSFCSSSLVLNSDSAPPIMIASPHGWWASAIYRLKFVTQTALMMASSGIMVFGLSGCITAPVPPASLPAVIAQPAPAKSSTLSIEADNALKAAEQTVIETRVRRALWTAATEHLESARVAARLLNSDLTLKHAREVIALCQQSLQQKQSPPVTW